MASSGKSVARVRKTCEWVGKKHQNRHATSRSTNRWVFSRWLSSSSHDRLIIIRAIFRSTFLHFSILRPEAIYKPVGSLTQHRIYLHIYICIMYYTSESAPNEMFFFFFLIQTNYHNVIGAYPCLHTYTYEKSRNRRYFIQG